jgi:thiamine biosynthesis lipoprotein
MPFKFDPGQHLTALHRFEHQAMNCDWEIFIANEDGEYARQAAFAAFEEVDRTEADLSRFREGSDVRRLNAAAPGETIRVGPYTRDCLLLAGELSELTGGAFDVMVARAMDEIRAGGGSSRDLLPQEPLLEIDPLSGAVTILGEGVAIDLGAIGKGYAIDCLIEVLREWNITAALAHAASSSAYALGAPPGSEGWHIALSDPRDLKSHLATLFLRDTGIGGSGTATQGMHILDPRTGLAVKGKIASWCLCDTATRADAFSTAIFVMSEPELAAFSNNVPEASGLVLLERNGGIAVRRWGALEAIELDEESLSQTSGVEIAKDEAMPFAENVAQIGPLLKAHLNSRITVVWKDHTRRSGVLTAADNDWLQLQCDDGPVLLIPREAIACLEMES